MIILLTNCSLICSNVSLSLKEDKKEKRQIWKLGNTYEFVMHSDALAVVCLKFADLFSSKASSPFHIGCSFPDACRSNFVCDTAFSMDMAGMPQGQLTKTEAIR